MKLKHNTTAAFSIAGVTALLVAAAVWAAPQPKSSSVLAGCPGKTIAVEKLSGGGGAGRAAP